MLLINSKALITPIEEKIEVFDTFIKNPISSEEINTIINKTK